MTRVSIDPITRIEGHLKVEIEVEDGEIREARCSGALYRGLERILLGRHPLDAQRITTRICGVCPLAHSTAAALCLDDALGLQPPRNGQLLRNLIYGANFLHNHILHFYHLALPDYLPAWSLPGALSPGTDEDRRTFREESQELAEHYLQALEMRRKAQELVALFGGKMPHDMSIVPGGVTYRPTPGEVAAFRFRLKEIVGFIRGTYIPDLLLLAERYHDYFEIGQVGNLLTFGCFSLDGQRLFPAGAILGGEYAPLDAGAISEETAHSWYRGNGAQPPREEETEPDPDKAEGYSWIKSPRYRGEPCEVGPAARVAVGLREGPPGFREIAGDLLREVDVPPESLSSVMGRHLARGIEALFIAQVMERWLSELDLSAPVAVEYRIPWESEGAGLIDAPRGALGHWVRISDKRIAHYQVIAPTTWNASPRDEKGVPGPIEQALQGTKVSGDGVLEAGRIVRSFDPCLACAIQ
ncbi:nickel-dependent hydrogenase large subunit [Candidatus Bipolaricaulota sp. J31]